MDTPVWLRKLLGRHPPSEETTTRRNAGDTLILFIHGLSGSGDGTWGPMLKILAGDYTLKNVSFDCFSYPTTIIRTGLGKRMASIQQIAAGLKTHLDIVHSDKREVIIIGHSLGGLIARYYILDELKAKRGAKIKGVALFASPHTGAELASIGRHLSISQRHLKQLTPHNDLLDAINKDWITLNAEDNLRAIFIVGGGDKIVSERSASPYIGAKNVRTLIDFGHREIIKPEGPEDIRYKVLQKFTEETLQAGTTNDQQVQTVTPQSGDPLFDFYTPASEPYYFKRRSDEVMFLATRSANAWVSGPTGSGKTVTLRRLVSISNWSLQHISMGSYTTREAFPLLREICAEVIERSGSPREAITNEKDLNVIINQLCRAIEKLSDENPVGILIEEIPLPPGEEFAKFIELIDLLTLQTATLETKNRVVWLFSSISCPRPYVVNRCIKFRERVQLIEFEHWTANDLEGLFTLIHENSTLNITEPERNELIQRANGSPRFVKMVIRRKRNEVGSSHSINKLIADVAQELA